MVVVENEGNVSRSWTLRSLESSPRNQESHDVAVLGRRNEAKEAAGILAATFVGKKVKVREKERRRRQRRGAGELVEAA